MNLRIITFYVHQWNVGQRLQAFALQKFLYQNFKEKALIYDINDIPEFKKRFQTREWDYKFNFDKNLYIKKIQSMDDIINDNVDYFILGSDQIVNTLYMGRVPKEYNYYTLDFIDQNKKIPYALSFKHYMKYGIKTKTISFREDIDKNELDLYGYNSIDPEIHIHIDPTFLLDKSEYTKYIQYSDYDIPFYDSKNCLYYIVPETKMQVEEFLFKIKNYNGMIRSNSYHAFCFSVIFNKRISLYNQELYLDKRVKQVIKTLNIKYGKDFQILNYDEVLDRIHTERQKTLEYFKRNLI